MVMGLFYRGLLETGEHDGGYKACAEREGKLMGCSGISSVSGA